MSTINNQVFLPVDSEKYLNIDLFITQNWGPVTQIAYQVGFTTPSYFAKMFKTEFGVLPSEYLEKSAKPTLNPPNP